MTQITKDDALQLALGALSALNDTKSCWWQEVDDATMEKMKQAFFAINQVLDESDEQSQAEIFYGDRIILPKNLKDPLIVIKGGMNPDLRGQE